MTRTFAAALFSLTLAACSSGTDVDEPSFDELVTVDRGIAGTVTWSSYGADDGVEDSGPVEGETMTISLDQDPPEAVATTVTDEYGFFEVELEDGAYVLGRSEGETTTFVIEGNVVACHNSTNPGLGPAWECRDLK